jgi:glucose-6-phosphate 1-dehydrogenase
MSNTKSPRTKIMLMVRITPSMIVSREMETLVFTTTTENAWTKMMLSSEVTKVIMKRTCEYNNIIKDIINGDQIFFIII